MLDVRRLHMLRELSERGTIAATAEALGYSAPAVSQHLAALERQVGVALLERQGRRVVLTPAARLLVGRTERVLAELEAAEAELAAGDGDVRGSVRLAAFPTAAATLVPRAMATFAARHPHAEVLLAELEPEDALPALKLGEADSPSSTSTTSARAARTPASSSRPLAEDEIHVAVPAGHPGRRRGDRAAARWPTSAGSPATSTPPATASSSPPAAPPASSRASSRAPTTSASCSRWWPPARASRSSPGSRSTAARTACASRGPPSAGSRGASSPPCARAAASTRRSPALLDALREAAGHTLGASA